MSALAAYARDLRRAGRLGREPAPTADAVVLDPSPTMWRRLWVTHAAERLAPRRCTEAAWGGLQDSVPRAGLLGLHARLADVAPDAWEDPRLVQIWLRWAAHIVPRRDVGVFTVGALPRDPVIVAALEQLADAVLALLVDGRQDSRAVRDGLPDLPDPSLIRAAAVTGRIHIRWDTRTTDVIAAERPPVDAEETRIELCRRFLHWHGPAGPRHFARWAGVTASDAEVTWRALAPETTVVDDGGRQRWLLRADVDAVRSARRPEGVRLLPAGDPCLTIDAPAPPPAVPPRLLYTLTGRILLGGDVVGAWGRRGAAVTLAPWTALGARRRQAVDAEAARLAAPLGAPVSVRWLDRDG